MQRVQGAPACRGSTWMLTLAEDASMRLRGYRDTLPPMGHHKIFITGETKFFELSQTLQRNGFASRVPFASASSIAF